MAASAGAANITYSTDTALTGFNNTTANALSSSSGQAATLTFDPNINNTTGIPSNVDLGDFYLVCSTCSTQTGGVSATFSAFTFNLIITDVTDGNTEGQFVGTSTGGTIFTNSSGIVINWVPLQLGPGTNNTLPGDGAVNFGTTEFIITSPTGIVAQTSGGGDSTVQGFVTSSALPEPATFALIGGALLGLGVLRRKSLSRQ